MSDSNNPYQPPRADVTPPPLVTLNTYELTAQPRTLPLGAVFSWLGEGWRLYKKDWGLWLLINFTMLALFIGVGIILEFIPLATSLISGLISGILMIIFTGGMYIGLQQSANGGKLAVNHLFAGFKQALMPLIIIGVISSLLSLATAWLTGTLTPMPEPVMPDNADMSPEQAMEMAFSGINFSALFLQMLISSLIGLFFWFAIPLVALHQVPVLNALKLSFNGALRNIIALIIYLIISFVLSIIGSIPLFLGLLVVMPWLLCSNYIAYRQIFTKN